MFLLFGFAGHLILVFSLILWFDKFISYEKKVEILQVLSTLTVLLVFLIQNGVTSSIKPQQVTFIVPGIDNFDHTEISNFIQKAQDNLVSSSYLNNG